MRVNARPAPILRPPNKPRADGVERDIRNGRRKVRLVHRDASEPPLPEIASALLARLNMPRIGAVHARQRRAQAVGVSGRKDQRNMVRHQDPRPHRSASAMFLQQVEIERVVVIAEKRPLTAVPALCYMMRRVGNDKASEASHGGRLSAGAVTVN